MLLEPEEEDDDDETCCRLLLWSPIRYCFGWISLIDLFALAMRNQTFFSSSLSSLSHDVVGFGVVVVVVVAVVERSVLVVIENAA